MTFYCIDLQKGIKNDKNKLEFIYQFFLNASKIDQRTIANMAGMNN